MILQSLVSYYDRMGDRLARPGWIQKRVDFVVVLSTNGEYITVNDLREKRNEKLVGKYLLLPNIGKQSQKHNNSGKDANLLWDDAQFLLGYKSKGEVTTESFCRTFSEFFPDPKQVGDEGISAMARFCQEQLPKPEIRETIAASLPHKNDQLLPVITAFRLDGDDSLLISDRKAVHDLMDNYTLNGEPDGICLVTGRRTRISKNHTVLKNVPNGQPSGVSLVSFNVDAFNSYNLESGYNAPVGELAMFKYTTALNHLLGKDSSQCMQVGDTTLVFWSASPSELESSIIELLTEPPHDDPERNTRAVRALFDSFKRGKKLSDNATDSFYVLGLAPNNARLAVRFWIVGTIAEMETNILRHFEDIRIAHGSKERDELSLSRLIKQTIPPSQPQTPKEDWPATYPQRLEKTSTEKKDDKFKTTLTTGVTRSILKGIPYPQAILAALVRRTRTERFIPHARAAFLKACLNRSSIFGDQNEKEIHVSLDRENKNIGYRLGRLFATLEKTQNDSLESGNKGSLRSRYYGSASSTPEAVFPTLIRTSKHHLDKLNTGAKVKMEKLLGEIFDGIIEFPATLSLSEQGRFAIGYYHQMQDLYNPNKVKNQED